MLGYKLAAILIDQCKNVSSTLKVLAAGNVPYYFETSKFILKFIFQPVIIPVDKAGSSEKQTYKPPKYGACQWLIKVPILSKKIKWVCFMQIQK